MTARTRATPSPTTTGRPPAAAHRKPAAAATRLEKAGRRLLVPVLLLLFCAQALSSVTTKSATWDETNYFGMGDYLLRNWRWDVPSAVIHPPLAHYLDSVPLLFAPLDRQVWNYSPEARRDPKFLGAADIDRGQALLSSPANGGDRLLTLSRLMVIIQAMLLGYFVYRFGVALHGLWAGMLALSFFALCPNMIAHGSLITPDMTLAVFFFITIYFFRMALVSDRWTYHVLAGSSLGLALLSKFPALLLFPIKASSGGPRPARAAHPRQVGGCFVGLRLLVLFAGWLRREAIHQGITVQQSHGPGQMVLPDGRLSRVGWWYCLVAFVLRDTDPLLLFLSAGFVLFCVKIAREAITVDDLVLWVPIAAIFAFFSVELRSIGLRYVLPAYPFAFVLASGAVLQLKRLRYLLILPLLWYPVASLSIWPDYLAYFNEFAGGATTVTATWPIRI
jgi:4-amino-4-deoxy-L-arabinose transferase-like glycosyltransferase